MAAPEFMVRIWGARGSAPAPAAGNCDYGTDTCCVEMRCGGRVLIFDAGSGIISLGARLVEERVTDFDLFFSHCHLDHIVGLPMLKPLYHEAVRATFYAGHFQDDTTCRTMAEGFMRPPFFPVTPKSFRASIDFRDFRVPDVLTPGPGISIATTTLNHPNGAVGFRVNHGGRSVCYVTDTEHVPGAPDAGILALIAGADMLIYDCSYSDEEFEQSRGFGHSTWQEGVRLCESARVPRLVIFHHRPGRDDAALRVIEAEARRRLPGAMIGGVGLELAL
jgi:phosphoribosyl 1,2-cyclic phosphodiesterase